MDIKNRETERKARLTNRYVTMTKWMYRRTRTPSILSTWQQDFGPLNDEVSRWVVKIDDNGSSMYLQSFSQGVKSTDQWRYSQLLLDDGAGYLFRNLYDTTGRDDDGQTDEAGSRTIYLDGQSIYIHLRTITATSQKSNHLSSPLSSNKLSPFYEILVLWNTVPPFIIFPQKYDMTPHKTSRKREKLILINLSNSISF